jgi:hypothetical protein
LYETSVYRENQRNGMRVSFSSTGAEIARCEYRADEPWTGRLLERNGFSPVLWDVGYRDGKLDGAEIHCESDGTISRLRTFRAGILHGVSQNYFQGVLRSEEIYENGRYVSHRSWYPNGQLEWTNAYDENGRPHGRNTRHKATGELDIEWNHNHGDRHGRWWETGQQETWYWYKEHLGPGTAGQREFEKRRLAGENK